MRGLRIAGAVAGASLLFALLLLFATPRNFAPVTLSIPVGSSAASTAATLAQANVIAHPLVLRLVLRFSGGGEEVQAGTYRFSEPESALSVARRLAAGEYGIPPVRLTFPEGSTVRQMAERVTGVLPHVSVAEFIAAASPHEGYLFPDTYFFSVAATTSAVIAEARENFDAKVAPLLSDVAASGRTLKEIVIMASIIEKEARTYANRELVSGVLSNRIKKGMPLQVDAVFGYIFNRDTYSPTYEDLKADSPYNTYLRSGLPPGPINNPGLESLKAALYPASTDYLYYLTGKDGVMYYAKTYAQHQENLRRHLR